MTTYQINTNSNFANLAFNAKTLMVDKIKNVKIATINFLDNNDKKMFILRKDINYLNFLTKNKIINLKPSEQTTSETTGETTQA